jgi:hypothetical protein
VSKDQNKIKKILEKYLGGHRHGQQVPLTRHFAVALATDHGIPHRGGVAQWVERVLYHSTRRAVPERSWVQSLLPTTEVEPEFSTFGGMLVSVLQLISPMCKTGTSVLSRESHLNRSPTQGQNVTRGGQSIDTLCARACAPADCCAEMSTQRKSNVAPRAPYNIRLGKLSTRMSHTIPASLNKD